MNSLILENGKQRHTRRTVARALGLGAGAAATGGLGWQLPLLAQTPAATLDELVIDLAGEPESIDPVFAYSPRDWSIVHAIYDAPVGFAADGSIEPLAASSFEAMDERTFRIVMREGLSFHDGSPVDAQAVARSVTYMQESGSEASSLFAGITGVEVGSDGLTATVTCASPSPWLPAQMAVWLVLLPEGFSAESARSAPVGSGPYRYESMQAGSSITLVRNPDYAWGSPKGTPIAERVTYRFVPEPTTRVADLASGSAQIISEIPFDQAEDLGESASYVEMPIVASAWIRIATDVAPFDDQRVRQALNLAVDAESIAQALVSPESHRIANLFPDDRALGFDPGLSPHEYDPAAARALLEEAGHADPIDVVLEITTGARVDVAEAIVSQLAEGGFDAEITVSEYAAFNSTWKDASAPVLRLVTWGPLYDPHSLLSLVFASEGFLSRYANPELDALIAQAGEASDPAERQSVYEELGELMHEDAPAIFLWNLVSGYGVADVASEWTPRGDEYVLPLSTGQE